MGTITQRKNKKGGIKYTAQIRFKRAGKVVYQEAQSFYRKLVAQGATWKLTGTGMNGEGALS
ncbi:hypothetical protein [Pseudomonas viridiflava]|uniref:hypothetical protein n=1 Tax=Pseudomonas viridiflava TaxID=33069 RepID=UPI000F015C12